MNGIQVNHVVEWEQDGKASRCVGESIAYDQPIDPAVFRKPGAGALACRRLAEECASAG